MYIPSDSHFEIAFHLRTQSELHIPLEKCYEWKNIGKRKTLAPFCFWELLEPGNQSFLTKSVASWYIFSNQSKHGVCWRGIFFFNLDVLNRPKLQAYDVVTLHLKFKGIRGCNRRKPLWLFQLFDDDFSLTCNIISYLMKTKRCLLVVK